MPTNGFWTEISASDDVAEELLEDKADFEETPDAGNRVSIFG